MINYSMLNDFASWLMDIVGGLFGSIFDFILMIFNNLFYFVFKAIGSLADMVQALFRAFCGLGNSTEFGSYYTDDVYFVFQHPKIQNILIAMGVLALLLLIITTGIAVIKTEFTGLNEKGGNSKSKVIGGALKSLANIVVVPICAIIAVLAVNAVLRAVDQITSGGSSTSLASQVFIATAYDANKLRTDTDAANGWTAENYATLIANNVNTFNMDFEKYFSASGANRATSQAEKYALVVDYLFLNNVRVEGAEIIQKYLVNGSYKEFEGNFPTADLLEEATSNSVAFYCYFYNMGSGWGFDIQDVLKNSNSFTYQNKDMVQLYYDLDNFNILVALLAVITVAFNLLTIILSIVKRFFELTILLVISPPVAAVTPIDGGSALKNWRQTFISSLLSLFGPVVAINMLFIILPILFEIDFLGTTGITAAVTSESGVRGLESLVEVLLTCAGIIYVKELSGKIGKIFGGDNAADTGNAVKDFTGKVKTASAIGKTMGAAGMAPFKMVGASISAGVKAKASGATVGQSVGSAFKGMGLSALSSGDKVIGSGANVVGGTIGNDKFGEKYQTVASDSMDKMGSLMYKGVSGVHFTRAALAKRGSDTRRIQAAKGYDAANASESFENTKKLRHTSDYHKAQELKGKIKDSRAAAGHDAQMHWSRKENENALIDSLIMNNLDSKEAADKKKDDQTKTGYGSRTGYKGTKHKS